MAITKKPALGRALGSLLGEVTAAKSQSQQASDGELLHLPVELLQRGKYQPRREIDPVALQELADSIRAQGILQPVVVRKIMPQGHYEIIAGERRWRAAQLAGLSEIPALIRDIPDATAMALALIENIQRENLNAIEEAAALQRLLNEFNMTHQEVAQAVGKSRATVTNLLRLMGLNPDVKVFLEKNQLEMGHARALLALEGIAQTKAANLIIDKQLSVRETEHLVRELLHPKKLPAAKKLTSPDIRRLETQLSEQLGASVKILHSTRGKGKLVINYNNLDELDGILNHIK